MAPGQGIEDVTRVRAAHMESNGRITALPDDETHPSLDRLTARPPGRGRGGRGVAADGAARWAHDAAIALAGGTAVLAAMRVTPPCGLRG